MRATRPSRSAISPSKRCSAPIRLSAVPPAATRASQRHRERRGVASVAVVAVSHGDDDATTMAKRLLMTFAHDFCAHRCISLHIVTYRYISLSLHIVIVTYPCCADRRRPQQSPQDEPNARARREGSRRQQQKYRLEELRGSSLNSPPPLMFSVSVSVSVSLSSSLSISLFLRGCVYAAGMMARSLAIIAAVAAAAAGNSQCAVESLYEKYCALLALFRMQSFLS